MSYNTPKVTIDLAEYNELLDTRTAYQQNFGTGLKISDIVFMELLSNASEELVEKINKDLVDGGWMVEVSMLSHKGPSYINTYKHPVGGLKIIK